MTENKKKFTGTVEVLTWGTHDGAGNGLLHFLDKDLFGGNVGHASIKMSIPATEENKKILDEENTTYKVIKTQTQKAYKEEDKWKRSQTDIYEEEYYEVYWSWWPKNKKDDKFTLETDLNKDRIDERAGVDFPVRKKFKDMFQKRMQRGRLGGRKITEGPFSIIHQRDLSDEDVESFALDYEELNKQNLMKSCQILFNKIRGHGYDFESDPNKKKDALKILSEIDIPENGSIDLNSHTVDGKLLFYVLCDSLAFLDLSINSKFPDISKFTQKDLDLFKKLLVKKGKKTVDGKIGTTEKILLNKIFGEQWEAAVSSNQFLTSQDCSTLLDMTVEKYTKTRKEHLEIPELKKEKFHQSVENKTTQLAQKSKYCREMQQCLNHAQKILDNFDSLDVDGINFHFKLSSETDVPSHHTKDKMKEILEAYIVALQEKTEILGVEIGEHWTAKAKEDALHSIIMRDNKIKKIIASASRTKKLNTKTEDGISLYAANNWEMPYLSSNHLKNKQQIRSLEHLHKITLTDNSISLSEKSQNNLDELFNGTTTEWRTHILDLTSISANEKKDIDILIELRKKDISDKIELLKTKNTQITNRIKHLNETMKPKAIENLSNEQILMFVKKIGEEAEPEFLKRKTEHELLSKKRKSLPEVASTYEDDYQSWGLAPDHTVELPLGNDIDAMNLRDMLIRMNEIKKEEEFDLSINNCSVTAGSIIAAGAPKRLKPFAKKLALGAIGNPQTVYSSALEIRNHIGNKKHVSLLDKTSLYNWSPLKISTNIIGKQIYKLLNKKEKIINKVVAAGVLLFFSPISLTYGIIKNILQPLKSLRNNRSIFKYLNSSSSKKMSWKAIKLVSYLSIGISSIISAPTALVSYTTNKVIKYINKMKNNRKLSKSSFNENTNGAEVDNRISQADKEKGEKIKERVIGHFIEISGLEAIDALNQMYEVLLKDFNKVPIFSPEQQQTVNSYLETQEDYVKDYYSQRFDNVLRKANRISIEEAELHEVAEHLLNIGSSDRTNSSEHQELSSYKATSQGWQVKPIVISFPENDIIDKAKMNFYVEKIIASSSQKTFTLSADSLKGIDYSNTTHTKFLNDICTELYNTGITIEINDNILSALSEQNPECSTKLKLFSEKHTVSTPAHISSQSSKEKKILDRPE